jgi:hypothetical protein
MEMRGKEPHSAGQRYRGVGSDRVMVCGLRERRVEDGEYGQQQGRDRTDDPPRQTRP